MSKPFSPFGLRIPLPMLIAGLGLVSGLPGCAPSFNITTVSGPSPLEAQPPPRASTGDQLAATPVVVPPRPERVPDVTSPRTPASPPADPGVSVGRPNPEMDHSVARPVLRPNEPDSCKSLMRDGWNSMVTYARTDQLNDINQAIGRFRKFVARPDCVQQASQRRTAYTNLGFALFLKFSLFEATEALEQAATAAQGGEWPLSPLLAALHECPPDASLTMLRDGLKARLMPDIAASRHYFETASASRCRATSTFARQQMGAS